jgi:hypothetical protein
MSSETAAELPARAEPARVRLGKSAAMWYGSGHITDVAPQPEKQDASAEATDVKKTSPV